MYKKVLELICFPNNLSCWKEHFEGKEKEERPREEERTRKRLDCGPDTLLQDYTGLKIT